MSETFSFFKRWKKVLIVLATLYVVLLIVSHAVISTTHVWLIAAFFSILMNFVYITEAYWSGHHLRSETFVAVVLIGASMLGVLMSPLFVIAAIFGHGVWDLAKHMGAGVPFFKWYTLNCAIADITYSLVLFIYLFHRATV